MIEIKVPQLAESINEGTIAKWLKKEGDVVQAGDILLELETDKVNLEINAEEDGILKERLKQEGETVFVGEVIARMAEEGLLVPLNYDNIPNYEYIPESFKGLPVTLIAASFISLAFFGFAGIVDNLFA